MSLFVRTTVILVALVLWVSPTQAQKKDSGTANLLKIAERLFLEGIKLAQKRKFNEALAKFRASYRIVPASKEPKNEQIRGTLHLLIGRTYHRMGKPILARDHYRRYLKLMPSDHRRPKVVAWLKMLFPILKATIQLKVAPRAQCTATSPKGPWSGRAPATITVESGAIEIRCEAEGFRPGLLKFAIAPKQHVTKELTLIPLPKPPKDMRWLGLVIGGVGLAAVAAGGIFGGLAGADLSQAKSVRDSAVNGEDSQYALELYAGAQQKALLANVFYIAGGGLAITGVILYFVLIPRKKPGKSSMRGRMNRSRKLSRFSQGIGPHERFGPNNSSNSLFFSSP